MCCRGITRWGASHFLELSHIRCGVRSEVECLVFVSRFAHQSSCFSLHAYRVMLEKINQVELATN